MNGGRAALVSSAMLAVLLLSVSINPIESSPIDSIHPLAGPFVDTVQYNVISYDDNQVLALQNDEVDIIGEFIDPTHIETLELAESISLETVPRNGYGYFTINCAKYPYNITAFRRAVAFAYDKNYVSAEVWDGLANPHDSCLPLCNPFTSEGLLSYNYYDTNIEIGNQLLDAAGFLDINGDELRECPNGSKLHVLVESAHSSNIAILTQEAMSPALSALHINHTIEPMYFGGNYLQRLYFHGDYDMMFIGRSFADFDVSWLAYDFWSEYADEPYYNYPNFKNDTYDSWRNQLLHATEYEEVYEAAFEMQRVWVHECPMIICYDNLYLFAHRNDRFDGFVIRTLKEPTFWWTNLKAHLKRSVGGPFGGTLRWAGFDIGSFNFIESMMYEQEWHRLQMLYDTLVMQDSEGHIIPWLAEDFTIEIDADNPSVPSGYTRITFDIFRNATWSDRTPLTAEDIVFTLNYLREIPSEEVELPVAEISAVYTPTSNIVVVEFASESYWHLYSLTQLPILPKHIFLEMEPSDFIDWNPHPPVDSMVTSGPFNVSAYTENEVCELSYNPTYFRGIDRETYTFSSTLSTSTSTSSSTIPSTSATSSTSEIPSLTTTIGHTTSTPQTPSIWETRYLGLTILEWIVTVSSVSVIVIVLVNWRLETFKISR